MIVLENTGHALNVYRGDFSRSRFGISFSIVLANIGLQNFHDSLDFEFSLPESSGELALVLRMRNSILNTVLLYDVMLKEQGFAAPDWMGHDPNHLGNHAELGLGYRENMGMMVLTWRDAEFPKVGMIGDQGPIPARHLARNHGWSFGCKSSEGIAEI